MSRRRAQGHCVERLEPRKLLSTYYVSPSGRDAAKGTSASVAWRTLQAAADRARAGDTVRVAAGTYAEGMNFFGNAGGTKAKPIQFLADPGAVITHAATEGINAGDAAINIESAGGWYVVRGFTIRGDGSMERAGIRVAASDHVQLLDNTVDGAFTGIFVSFSEGTAMVNNTCRNATDQHGIYVGSGTRWTIVRGNTLTGNAWDGLHLNATIEDPNIGAVVEANVVHDNGLSGMDVEGVTNATFRNNVIYDNAKHGITVHSQDQADTPPAAGNTFVNNTIAGNGMFAIVFRPEDTRGEVVFNNVLLSASTGNYGAIGVSGTPIGLVSDHNVVPDSFSTTLGDGHLSLAAWRSATGQDAHSIVADTAALFVNAAAGDYRPKAGARTIDAGSAGIAKRPPPSTDRAGGTRPQGRAWDVGAYEYQAAMPTPTRTPFGGSPLAIGASAVVQFENYDKGAEGAAYHDTDAANLGKAYRTGDGADVQAVPGGGYSLGFTKAGEWTEYTINVTQGAAYSAALTYASLRGGGKFHLVVDGKAVTPVTTVKSTRDWQKYQSLAFSGINLTAGQHVLRLAMDGNDSTGYVANFDRAQFTRATTRTPFKGAPSVPNQTIQAEDFDNGGEGVAYHDTDTANLGRSAYRTGAGVDVGDVSVGRALTFTKAGENLVYSLSVPTAGTFGLQVNLASLKGGGKFHFEIDGKSVAAFTAPRIGDWRKYTTLTSARNITLPAGPHTLRLVMDANDSTDFVANFDWLKLTT